MSRGGESRPARGFARCFAACARGLWWAGLASVPLSAFAAGGHHAVEDAALMEPGQCEVELWADRTSSTPERLLHAGAACRMGPVELGLGLDRRRAEPAGETAHAAQLKWARPLGDRLSVGLVASVAWQAGGRRTGAALVVPVSVVLADRWRLHANVGRDFPRGDPASFRGGASLAWQPTDAAQLIVEHVREGGERVLRLGGRWQFTPALSVDLSRAATRGEAAAQWWTLGLNVAFER